VKNYVVVTNKLEAELVLDKKGVSNPIKKSIMLTISSFPHAIYFADPSDPFSRDITTSHASWAKNRPHLYNELPLSEYLFGLDNNSKEPVRLQVERDAINKISEFEGDG